MSSYLSSRAKTDYPLCAPKKGRGIVISSGIVEVAELRRGTNPQSIARALLCCLSVNSASLGPDRGWRNSPIGSTAVLVLYSEGLCRGAVPLLPRSHR